jgi:hypothetical protein
MSHPEGDDRVVLSEPVGAVIVSENPNIGALGSAAYQEGNRRVKAFCGVVIDSPEQYLSWAETEVLQKVRENPETTRVIDRAIVRRGLVIPTERLSIPLTTEARVPLGGEWEGYDWVMFGRNGSGRILSPATTEGILNLAYDAANQTYEQPKPLPAGYSMEGLKGKPLSAADAENLAEIFRASFISYISDLTTADKVLEWASEASVFPVVVRDPSGRIVAVSSGDLASIPMGGRDFKFMEIGDSASNPNFRGFGLNRAIKHYLIAQGIQMGYHSIHAETRAAWGAPNFGNAKNGMEYCGTLFLNCVISGEQDVLETLDPDINDLYRDYGSLNVWAMTEHNPLWAEYAQSA